ncbi:hypothetical protein M2281_002344 [Mesorhizobium soli]|nr:hypothetical protein [Mesorhizobium soli]
MVKIILTIGATLMLLSSSATAQEKLGPCGADLRTLCPNVQPGNDRLRLCMREHLHEVSDRCLMQLAKFAKVRRLHPECGDYLKQQCGQVERGGGRFEVCLKTALGGLSDFCKDELARAVTMPKTPRK